MKPTGKITFYSRFSEDILSSRKTITIRNADDADYQPGQVLSVHTHETDEWFCDIQVESIQQVTVDDLNPEHARSENMSLEQLKEVIAEIYPGENVLFVISFHTTRTA